MGPATEGAVPPYSTKRLLPLLPTLRRQRLLLRFLCVVALFYLLLLGCWRAQDSFNDLVPAKSPGTGSSPLDAEESYHLGFASLHDYRGSLESFIATAFPAPLQPKLSKHLDRFLQFNSTEPLPEAPKTIWQTNDVLPASHFMQSWRTMNPEHDYKFLSDDDAEAWVRRTFKGSPIYSAWKFLPHPVMKADFLRYLLLLVEGGVYSDIDTTCLKPIKEWGADPDVKWMAGDGSPPSAIIGIEADVGDRADWHEWWSRPIQIVQWTILFSPGHPLLLDTVRRLYANTVEAQRRLRLDPGLESVILEKNLTILEWTGPAVFTDASLSFLQIESGLGWMDLRGLEKPLRAGSVTVLPVTGFSPGVGNFGAKETSDEQAMVHHEFEGSWKPRHRN